VVVQINGDGSVKVIEPCAAVHDFEDTVDALLGDHAPDTATAHY
jgi:hypothetical protein